MGKRSGFYWARLYSGPYLLIVIRYHKIYKDCKGSNNTVLALLHHFQGSIISLFASWISSFHFHLALQIWSPISTLSHKHEKKMKKSFRGERFFNTGNNKNKKDFETSSMNIFKNTGAYLERVRRVRSHPLKSSKGCAAPVLRMAFSYISLFLDKKIQYLAMFW